MIAKVVTGIFLVSILGYLWFTNPNLLQRNEKAVSQDIPFQKESSPLLYSSPTSVPSPILISPKPSLTPTPSQPLQGQSNPSIPPSTNKSISLDQEVNLVIGETVSLKGTDIKITVNSATLSDAKIASGNLSVSKGNQTMQLQYYIVQESDANEEVLGRMRTKDAFGYKFKAVNISTNSFTLRITQ